MRQGDVVYYVHTDHLGSTSLTTDQNQQVVARQLYHPYGTPRWSQGTLPTDYTFTGQRLDGGIGLMHYGARFYSPRLGRFVSADSIVPEPGDPQDFNRYAYVRNNPLRYRDPNGHCAWCPFALVLSAAYVGGRVCYELGGFIIPGAVQMRRDQIGGGLVTDLSHVIEQEAMAHSVDPVLVSAVLRHESAAIERRLLTLWPTMQPGTIANTAEYIQSVIPENFSIGPMQMGDLASIGPGQMQLRRARELEEMGYVTARRSDFARRRALLGSETSVEYVAGMLQYVSDQLHTLRGFNDLSIEDQQRLTLIAYNWGWTSNLLEEIEKRGLEGMIQYSEYDEETLDEY
jgi:RHS repeat-associated protein